MKPAPIAAKRYTRTEVIFVPDPQGKPICALDCGGSEYDAKAGWIMRDIESGGPSGGYPVQVTYCPEDGCGRRLDWDADDNPIVGPSHAELEAERDHYKRALRRELSSDHGLQLEATTVDELVREALAATAEVAADA